MRIRIEHLSKSFGQVPAVRDICLEIPSQSLFFLLGPSGCGKTTLLRLLAGFYDPDAGEIYFNDRAMSRVPPHRRNTGLVFQNYALWPHMTVAQNVAYGLEVRGAARAEIRSRVAEALAVVRMTGYEQRGPNELSGGQQQRVALARALVIQPDVLLLDEPLSNLDARLRLEMREEIRRIHSQVRITTVYVTHDQKEALSMAEAIAVMRDGRIEQVGEPRSVYRQPSNRFIADFMAETNWVAGEVSQIDGTLVAFHTACGTLKAPTAQPVAKGQKVWLGFRPEAIQMGSGRANVLHARIKHVIYLGEVEQYQLELGPGTVVSAFEQNPAGLRQVGSELEVHIRPDDLLVLAPEK